MMNFARRCKMAGLVLTLLATSQTMPFALPVSLPQISAWMPTKGQCAFIWAFASWVALRTRGTEFDYKLSDWREDLDKLMDSYNVFDSQSRETIVALYKKWIIGRRCTLDDTVLCVSQEDGSTLKTKKKKLRCPGFGLVGLVDAYFVQHLEDALKAINNLKGISDQYNQVQTLVIVK